MTGRIIGIVFLLSLSIISLAQVGINTINPTETLDVNGTARIRLIEEMPINATLDSILVTDENGVVKRVSISRIQSALGAETYTSSTVDPVIAGGERVGDTFFNETTSTWWYFNGAAWQRLSGNSSDSENILSIGSDGLPYLGNETILDAIEANNGLTINSETIQLGGNLVQPTEITTDNANTLAITGLETSASTDEVVTINPATGVLTKSPISNLSEQYQIVYNATNGQTQFNTPATISDINKVDVYRNGVRIGLTQVDTDTIELETGVVCFENDEIRIVQLN